MALIQLPADAPSDEVYDALTRDGCVVIDRVLDRATIDALRGEMAPYVAAAPNGEDAFVGFETKRADLDGLLEWFGCLDGVPKSTYVVHGEEKAALSFASALNRRFGAEVEVPRLGQQFDLD